MSTQRETRNPGRAEELEIRIDQDADADYVKVAVPPFGTIVAYDAYIVDNDGATSMVARVRRWPSASATISDDDADGGVLLLTTEDAVNPTLVSIEPWRTYATHGPNCGWLWLYATPNQDQRVRHVLRVLPRWERAP